jgi:hypothetical protein
MVNNPAWGRPARTQNSFPWARRHVDEVWFTDAQGFQKLADRSARWQFGPHLGGGLSVEKVFENLVIFRAGGSPRAIPAAAPMRARTIPTARSSELHRS